MPLLKESQNAAVLGMKTAAQILQISKPNAKKNAILKSKSFAFECACLAVEQEMMEKEYTAPLPTIVEGDKQAVNKYEPGSGSRYVNVKKAHRASRTIVHMRIAAKSTHQQAFGVLNDARYKSGHINGNPQYFCRWTGDGVGLGRHKKPSLSQKKIDVKTGNMITIEPGIYYRGMDEFRIEEVGVVADEGFEFLAPCKQGWGL